MGPVAVVMGGVLGQHGGEVSLVDDQEAVGALAAHGRDPALGVRVRLGRGADDLDAGGGEYGVERGAELRVPITDQVSQPVGLVVEVQEQISGLLSDPGASGVGGDAGDMVRGGWRSR